MVTPIAPPGMEFVQPLIDTIHPLLIQISVFLGGLFGIYIILIAIRIYYDHKNYKLLRDIRYDLDQLNQHYGLECSTRRPGIFHRLSNFIHGKKEQKKNCRKR